MSENSNSKTARCLYGAYLRRRHPSGKLVWTFVFADTTVVSARFRVAAQPGTFKIVKYAKVKG